MEVKRSKSGINAWAEDDRPREKLQLKGRHALSDAELLAIILGSGNKTASALDLAKQMLSYFGGLNKLLKAEYEDLVKFKGVGLAKAVGVLSCMELSRRLRTNTKDLKSSINSSKKAFEVLRAQLSDLSHEEFWVVFLNRANYLISTKRISHGGFSGTVADQRIIFKLALDRKASSIILCHNHPSGNLKPSQADIQLTNKIAKAGELLDVVVLDHLIIGDAEYFSFADEEILG